jgi:hypothetical protein
MSLYIYGKYTMGYTRFFICINKMKLWCSFQKKIFPMTQGFEYYYPCNQCYTQFHQKMKTNKNITLALIINRKIHIKNFDGCVECNILAKN